MLKEPTQHTAKEEKEERNLSVYIHKRWYNFAACFLHILSLPPRECL